MDAPSAAVVQVFVAAYRPYVERRLVDQSLPIVHDAIDTGERWLRTTLEAVLSAPFAEQRRSPLEIFQEAMRFPTEALRSRGASESPRDPVAVAALPGDAFDLAPASSQALGEEAWNAHLRWGAAKAQAHAAGGPSVIHVTRNLLDASRTGEAATRAGYELTVVAQPPAGERRFAVGFVDLEHPDADDAVRALVERCGRVIAYGPHVDDFAMVRARSLGATEAVPRSRFFRDPGAWLPVPV